MPRSLAAVARGALVLVLAVGGAVVILLVISGQDAPRVIAPAGPGVAGAVRGGGGGPPVSGSFHVTAPLSADGGPLSDDVLLDALARGDVVLVYGQARPPAALRRVAGALAPPFSPALAAAGGAVVLDRRPGTAGVLALAWQHQIQADRPDDPALSNFVDYWLGRGRPGHTPS